MVEKSARHTFVLDGVRTALRFCVSASRSSRAKSLKACYMRIICTLESCRGYYRSQPSPIFFMYACL